MNEIKLIEEIEDAIHNKKYDELLYKVELKLKKLFYKYTTEDVLTIMAQLSRQKFDVFIMN